LKNYLVTGGAGFIGSNFIIYMLNKYDDILLVNFDSLTYAGNLENLNDIKDDKRHVFIKGDVLDKKLVTSIMEKYDIDVVVNFAAESHVDRSIIDPDVFAQTNIMGTLNMLNCAKDYWQEGEGYKKGVKFLQVSTDEVYGSLGDTGYFTEDTPLAPNSPYAASKASAELMVRAYGETFKLPCNITCCSNNYGPYQFPEKLIPLMINNCLNKKDLPIYGDGLNVRDWLYVSDHCRAIDMVIEGGRQNEVYSVGGHNERTNIHIVKTIIDVIGRTANSSVTEELMTYVTDRKGHDRRYAIDPKKIYDELGWQPQIMFEEGIEMTIKWYIDNREWMANITSGDYQKYYDKMYDKKK